MKNPTQTHIKLSNIRSFLLLFRFHQFDLLAIRILVCGFFFFLPLCDERVVRFSLQIGLQSTQQILELQNTYNELSQQSIFVHVH